MTIQVKKNRRRPTRDPLAATVRLAIIWLFVQGAVYVLAFDAMAYLLKLRWNSSTMPVLKMLGVTQLAVAFFLSKALTQPKRQYLAVDTLLVLLLGQSVVTMSAMLQGVSFLSDWFTLTLNIGLSASLLARRVKASKRPATTESPIAEPTKISLPVAVELIPVREESPRATVSRTSKIMDSLAWLQSQSARRQRPGGMRGNTPAAPRWARNTPLPIENMKQKRPLPEETLQFEDIKGVPASIGVKSDVFKGKDKKADGGRIDPNELLKPPQDEGEDLVKAKLQAALKAREQSASLKARPIKPPPIPLPPMAAEPAGLKRRPGTLSEAVPTLK